jgi:hypothetical protein
MSSGAIFSRSTTHICARAPPIPHTTTPGPAHSPTHAPRGVGGALRGFCARQLTHFNPKTALRNKHKMAMSVASSAASSLAMARPPPPVSSSARAAATPSGAPRPFAFVDGRKRGRLGGCHPPSRRRRRRRRGSQCRWRGRRESRRRKGTGLTPGAVPCVPALQGLRGLGQRGRRGGQHQTRCAQKGDGGGEGRGEGRPQGAAGARGGEEGR